MKTLGILLGLASTLAIASAATAANHLPQPSRVGVAIAAVPKEAMDKPGDTMMKPGDTMMKKPGDSMMAKPGQPRSGKFVKGEHPTQGTAKLMTVNGKAYVEFDSAFKTDSGPDLYVILYRNAQPPISGIKAQDYVSVAKLQKVSGAQRYAIPPSVKPEQFSSVAIWCRKFNATFGYAKLGS